MGKKRSTKSEAEFACVLLAWEAGEICEMRAAEIMGIDLVTARERKNLMIEEGKRLAEARL